MFDIGFTELLLIGLISLLILGPERLPVAARMTGLWLGRLRRSFTALKSEVEREIGADDIRRQLHNEHILELEREMRQNLDLESATRPGADHEQPQSIAKPPAPPSEGPQKP